MSGHVHLFYDSLGTPTIEKPDGWLLSTAGTTTAGIQEAINFAETNHVPLIVDGWSGAVEVTGGIKINSTTAQHYEFRGLWLKSSASIAALTIDAPVLVRFSWSGLIEYVGTGTEAVLFDPQNPAPGIFGTAGEGRIAKFGHLHFPTVYVSAGTAQAVVRFRSNNHQIHNQRIFFDAIHGGLIAQYGIYVMNPAPVQPKGVNCFAENYIDFKYISGVTSVGLQIGSGPIVQLEGPLLGNHWVGSIAAATNMIAYVGSFADHEILDIRSMSIDAGTVQYGAAFQGHGNIARMTQIQATNSIAFGGTKNKVYAPDTGTSGPPIGAGLNGNQLIQ